MKNAILLHGTSCTPDSYWLPSIKKFLEKNGYSVWAPQLPDPDAPDLKKQLPLILEKGKFTPETVIIGHSAGGPLVLSILENINVKINKAILVAGYARPLHRMSDPQLKKEEDDAVPILQKQYDWKKIKNNAKDIVFINSDNDPWGCDDKEGDYMFRNLGGTLIIRHGEGHMGSDSFNQPYKKFPLLEKLLELS
ncbi:MAG: alpha/beta hydrolase [Nitrososphaerota archaeon]|jgi:predicted alpha/beta hydrolase family esterase|nr:alpha/beta hydrolase [Nitrososphaerota archaeon]